MRRCAKLLFGHVDAYHLSRREAHDGTVLIVVLLTAIVQGALYAILQPQCIDTIAEGDVVNIPANVKHWHGAARDSWFAHLAMPVPGENVSNEWFEPVNDKEYDSLK